MKEESKISLQEYLASEPENVDVIIQTFISAGTDGISLELPKGLNGKLPSFQNDMIVRTTFEVKKFSLEYPSVETKQNFRKISVYASGTSEDKITAIFKLEYLLIANFSSNPILKIYLSKNAFDMSGKKPYLEIVVVKLGNEGKLEYYQPIKGITEFGKKEINLFTNPIPNPNLKD
ncbi:MAG: hypothetical protein RL308_1958 [Bacteroidota bacterium]|jgi:hypothetical protein